MNLEITVREHYRYLTKLLIRKNLVITTMESCTSGQIASLITDTEGASAILKGALITYCNEAKISAGVPAEVIETYGVYSAQTAVAMAQACRTMYGADIGIGITGSIGTVDPANHDSIPGQIFYAICIGDQVYDFFLELQPQADRLTCKLLAADAVYFKLIKLIQFIYQ